MPKIKACVIGAGFSGLSIATKLAHEGHDVLLLEKNEQTGGRARRFSDQGFTFDMGPSWYWMPDVFEKYFQAFGKSVSDYYELDRLDPSYKVVFDKDDVMDIPAEMSEIEKLFEYYEEGSSQRLREFLSQAAYKYEVGINDLVYKPSRSLTEFIDPRLLYGVIKMDVFQSMSKHIRKFFSHPKLIQLMEFPVLFLGALPENTPALYSLMNYADMSLGTWYPKGGMYKIVEGMTALAVEKGVDIKVNHEVKSFKYQDNNISYIVTSQGEFEADVVIASADYNFVDRYILEEQFSNYSKKYWDERVMAPSCLIYYLGIDKKLENLDHHNLFFDTDFTKHAAEIYTTKEWPENPLFYVSVVSKTDTKSAPEGMENVFVLIPVATGLEDSEEIREKYYDMVMGRLESLTGQTIKDHVIYKRSYAASDFVSDYHAFKGNAYGLANTLKQTAILKPALKNKKLKNLYYTGQLTVPGPGVPPSIISGQVVAKEVIKDYA
ncbi:MAG: phytoene desaturase family protein [bacterium]|nr:phytoene desaturase family protein [bacterium]